MNGTTVTELAIAICLVPIGGALACFDSALTHVSPARIEEMVREGRRGAKRLQHIAADRARYTNLLLLLRVICELTATVLATLFAAAEWGGDWPVIVYTVAVMVVISYVLIGVGPRTMGRQHPYAVALGSSGVVNLLGRVLNPLAAVLIVIGNAITPGRGFREGPFTSEVEIRELVDL